MEQATADRAVAALRERNVMAHVASTGLYRYGIRVILADGREALWDADGTAGIEAQILRDGVLTGFVPKLAGSEDFDTDQIVAAIAGIDYDNPDTNATGSQARPERRPMGQRGGTYETRPRTGSATAPTTGLMGRLTDRFKRR